MLGTRHVITACFVLMALVILPMCVALARPVWPKAQGVYIAPSSETIPLFPRSISQFKPVGTNKTYWNHSFPSTGSIRIFEDNGWSGISDFPVTMNHCSDGVFMIRWRSANPDVRIAAVLSSSSGDGRPYMPSGRAKTGAFGYMYGINCEQPMFKIVGTRNANTSTLVDIYYELKFWQAAP